MVEMGKKYNPDFYRGFQETNLNVKQGKVISSMYSRAKEIAFLGKNLSELEKGYVAGVGDRLMSNWSGRALDGAELYASVGLINNKKIKEEIAGNLAKDLVKNPSSKYLRKVKRFMDQNNMGEFSKGINLEQAIINHRKKQNLILFSSVFVFLGVLLSSPVFTGGVLGIAEKNSFYGAGIFTLGIMGLFYTLKNKF